MTATWTFDIADPGLYNVFAQWTSYPNRAGNAPYTIYNNSQAVGPAILVDQRVNGGQFNQLGGPYSLAAGTLEVVLSDNASGYVIADAVQVLPYSGTTTPLPPQQMRMGTYRRRAMSQ